MKIIVYDGQEFKDRLSATTHFKPSLKMRLVILFCTRLSIEHEVFTKEIMPDHKAIGHVHVMSIFDSIRGWWWNKKGYGQMEANKFERQCDSQSQE